eukprot:SAG31_NODE_387_length_16403_cov_5.062071_8_plen_151_part_00
MGPSCRWLRPRTLAPLRCTMQWMTLELSSQSSTTSPSSMGRSIAPTTAAPVVIQRPHLTAQAYRRVSALVSIAAATHQRRFRAAIQPDTQRARCDSAMAHGQSGRTSHAHHGRAMLDGGFSVAPNGRSPIAAVIWVGPLSPLITVVSAIG